MISLPKNKNLVLFDGVCNLCNASVQYIIKHDKNNLFMFASLESKVGKSIIDAFHIDTNKTDSILLYTSKNTVYYKSTAALKIATHLGFLNSLMSVFFLVPPVIRNWVYDFIAKNRYKWYGKKNACYVPTPELKNRFLE